MAAFIVDTTTDTMRVIHVPPGVVAIVRMMATECTTSCPAREELFSED